MVLESSAVLEDTNMSEAHSIASEEKMNEEYQKNVTNGKKNLLCGDYPEAVACFQAACSIQSERYGETSPECADVFFWYGRALLELARIENGVLGNALKGVPETEESSDSDNDQTQFENTRSIPATEREQLRQEVENAMAAETEDDSDADDECVLTDAKDENVDLEKAKGVGKLVREMTSQFIRTGSVSRHTSAQKRLFENDITVEKSKEATATDVTAEVKPSETASTSKAESTPKNTEDNVEDPDDIPNMQLAWEMLELAKVLYTKKPKSTENTLDVAKCHLKLGELGMEIENYSQAIGDFLECLAIHKELLPEHDRRLAETHYSLGLAYTFDKCCDDALKHYRAALNVLEARVDFLNQQIDESDRKDEKNEENMKECSEIGEINELIPDINSKIEDVIQMKKEGNRFGGSSRMASDSETSIGFGASSSSSDKVCTVIPIRKASDTGSSCGQTSATDITHLMRRKRATPEDDSSAQENKSPTKKVKLDDGCDSTAVNGTSTKKTEEMASNGTKF